MKLKVHEIFYSLQGEGLSSGYPFLFVRLSACNLRCKYCDTTESFTEGEDLSFEQIYNQMNSLSDAEKVLITGGEPLLQLPVLNSFVRFLIEQNKEVYVETNGSINVSQLHSSAKRIIDVKTPGSGEGESFLMSNLDYLVKEDELKFVICNKEDFDWSVYFIRKYKLAGKCNLLFSPSFGAISSEELAHWILKEGLSVKLSLQLHKYLNIK